MYARACIICRSTCITIRAYKKKEETMLYTNQTSKCSWQSHRSVSCFQCLDIKYPGMPLLPFFDHPPTSFPVTTFGTSQSPRPSSVTGTNQNYVLSLAPYCLSTMSSQIHQNYSMEVEATQQLGQPVSVSFLHLPLSWLLFPLGPCGSGECGPSLPVSQQRRSIGSKCLLKM